jgi:hypothetical protein
MTPDEIALIAKLRDLSDRDQEMLLGPCERLLLMKARATTAPSNIVKFPIGRVVRERFYRGKDDPERVELDAAAASLSRAIHSLQRQRASVGAKYRHFIARKVAARQGGSGADGAE